MGRDPGLICCVTEQDEEKGPGNLANSQLSDQATQEWFGWSRLIGSYNGPTGVPGKNVAEHERCKGSVLVVLFAVLYVG